MTFSTPTGVSTQNPLDGVNECYRDFATIAGRGDRIATAHQLQGVNSEEGTEDHQSDAEWLWTGSRSVISINPAKHNEGLTLRQAALIAGFGYLIMPVAFAEFYIYPKLVIPGNIEQTAQNIVSHGGLFLAAIFCYLITFISDVVIAWALYVLLVPVNRSVSLLTAWFRLVYTAVALFGLLNLVTVFRLLNTPDYLTAFGSAQLHAQVKLLLNSFRYDWSMSLVIFGIHLGRWATWFTGLATSPR